MVFGSFLFSGLNNCAVFNNNPTKSKKNKTYKNILISVRLGKRDHVDPEGL